MTTQKNDDDLRTRKAEYLARCAKYFDETFTKDTFQLTFSEREKLIFGQFKEEARQVLEAHIAHDPQSAMADPMPAESILCHCGTEANLIKDEYGHPKIFERSVATENGAIQIQEYGYYCSTERKTFFPSAENTQNI